jgi:hypothetical protein
MKKSRKQYTSQEKIAILRRHFLDHTPVSDRCDELTLQPKRHAHEREFRCDPFPPLMACVMLLIINQKGLRHE